MREERAMPDGGGNRPLDRERLAAILGMMGSEHDGEALAAARMAERMRREAKTTWSKIVVPAPIETAGPPLPVAEMLQVWNDHVGCCLSDWELGFLRSIRWRRKPTPKQIAVIERTARRLLGSAP
jgi:hypothetical protein